MRTRVGNRYKLRDLNVGDVINVGGGKLLVVSDFIVDLPDKTTAYLLIDPNTGESAVTSKELDDVKFQLIDKRSKKSD